MSGPGPGPARGWVRFLPVHGESRKLQDRPGICYFLCPLSFKCRMVINRWKFYPEKVGDLMFILGTWGKLASL